MYPSSTNTARGEVSPGARRGAVLARVLQAQGRPAVGRGQLPEPGLPAALHAGADRQAQEDERLQRHVPHLARRALRHHQRIQVRKVSMNDGMASNIPNK